MPSAGGIYIHTLLSQVLVVKYNKYLLASYSTRALKTNRMKNRSQQTAYSEYFSYL